MPDEDGLLRPVTPSGARATLALSLMQGLGSLTRRANYRGIGRLALLLRHTLGSAPVQVRLSDASLITIDLCDYYWARLVFGDYHYEPEIDRLLATLRIDDFYWIDCGANIGYWCVRLLDRLPPDRIVAIEPAPETFARLVANSRLSPSPFRTINRAVADSSGRLVELLVSPRHAATHLASVDGFASRHSDTALVETTTIDDVVSALPETAIPVVVKLDVEGAEAVALRGAAATIQDRDLIVIYECHGSDRESPVTAHFLRDGRFDVFALVDGLRRVTSVEQAGQVKVDRRTGYNFVAIKKGFVPEGGY